MRCLTDSCEHAENPYYVYELAEHRSGFRIFVLVHIGRPRRIHPLVEACMYALTRTHAHTHTLQTHCTLRYIIIMRRDVLYGPLTTLQLLLAVLPYIGDYLTTAAELPRDMTFMSVGGRNERRRRRRHEWLCIIILYSLREQRTKRYRRYCVRRSPDLGQEKSKKKIDENFADETSRRVECDHIATAAV